MIILGFIRKKTNLKKIEMISKEVLDFINENELSKTFIDDAAKKAKAINCATHPYSFSHPQPFTASDKKELSHIVFQGRRTEDGYVRSGNVKVSRPLDLSGNAKDAKIWKFLMLKLSNGFTILENLRDRTPEAYELLQMDGRSKDDAIKLMDDFSLMFEQSDSQVTSSRIKQVYFHIGENQYHLLSVVTPSCLVFELKNRIAAIRNEKNEFRENKRNNYRDIYGIRVVKYGGAKPQNISFLNNANGGKALLLSSIPPLDIDELNIRLPKKDFFDECMDYNQYRSLFTYFHKYLSSDKETVPNNLLFRYRDKAINNIIDFVVQNLFLVRSSANLCRENLPKFQQVWLNPNELQRQSLMTDMLKEQISNSIVDWIRRTYYRLYDKRKVILGNSEINFIKEVISNREEFWL